MFTHTVSEDTDPLYPNVTYHRTTRPVWVGSETSHHRRRRRRTVRAPRSQGTPPQCHAALTRDTATVPRCDGLTRPDPTPPDS